LKWPKRSHVLNIVSDIFPVFIYFSRAIYVKPFQLEYSYNIVLMTTIIVILNVIVQLLKVTCQLNVNLNIDLIME